MKEVLISFPVRIKKFEHHERLKDQLLTAINEQEQFEHLLTETNDILRVDWNTSRFDRSRKWLSIIGIELYEHLGEWCKTLGYESFDVHEIWFQQYTTGGKHAWHVHGSNFTNVYYLDLPDDTPKTEWIDPVTGTEYSFDVSEGDIITFPSWLIHRAPMNSSNKLKTIISWNMDVAVSDFYGDATK